ncbi:MAG: hypothetical protein AAFU41_03820 [Pseudomonadota bacterium]
MSQDYTIGMLWMEGPLSYLEQLCMQSFLDAGHAVRLYHYGPVTNVPDGVEVADAGEILPGEPLLKYNAMDSVALHADLFRLRLLDRHEDVIWADTDAYCMKPFAPKDGFFFGMQSETSANTAVMLLPRDSETLKRIIAFTNDEYAIPTWYKPRYVRRLSKAKEDGNPVHVSDQPWGVWGPSILTHFLSLTGEMKHALPVDVLYPFSFNDRRKMTRADLANLDDFITERTVSIHFYGRRMRSRLASFPNGIPPKTSLVGQLIRKHGIDPNKAPVPRKAPPVESDSA